MVVYFPDVTLHRFGIVESQSGVYGETIQEYEYIDDIQVDLQDNGNHEIAHTYGIELSDLFKIYLDINTPLNDSDLLKDDTGTEYTIIGGVNVYRKFHQYKMANLKRRRYNEHTMAYGHQ